MVDTSHIQSIVFVLIACLTSATILIRFKQPTLIGYILAGILIGPHVLGIVPYTSVSFLAEIGVGLLMFSIGLELSIQKLLRVKTVAILGGSLMTLLCIFVGFALALVLHWNTITAFTLGCVFALSSTAVVLRLLSDRGEIGSTHGNISTGILLYQDIVAVPLLVIIPLLAQQSSIDSNFIMNVFGQILIYIVLLYASARFIVPKVLHAIAQTQSKELFSISVLCICTGIAAIAHHAGLSLALGAFIAGLIISESDFGNQATSEILPLKDSFSAIFFASFGMLLDPMIFVKHFPLLLLILLAVILVKFFICLIVLLTFRYPVKSAVFTSFALAQIGEFSFLLLMIAFRHEIIDSLMYQLVLATAILSIIVMPYLLKIAPFFAQKLLFLEGFSWISRGLERDKPTFLPEEVPEGLAQADGKLSSGHVILCGYGPTGSIVMKKLLSAGLPVVVIDLNYKVIQSLKSQKYSAIYGDCSTTKVLEAAGIDKALLLVITIPDPLAMKTIVKRVRHNYAQLPIYVRVKYNSERQKLLDLGATDVVWEEFEAGEELAHRTLAYLRLAET